MTMTVTGDTLGLPVKLDSDKPVMSFDMTKSGKNSRIFFGGLFAGLLRAACDDERFANERTTRAGERDGQRLFPIQQTDLVQRFHAVESRGRILSSDVRALADQLREGRLPIGFGLASA